VSQKQGILEWEFALHMPVALLVPLDSCPNSSWFVASAVHYCFQLGTAKSSHYSDYTMRMFMYVLSV